MNCTGGCTWKIYVKDGIVTWEMQAVDYPTLDPVTAALRAARLPARHLVFLVPLQPAARAVSLHARRVDRSVAEARAQHEDPVEAWRSLVEDPEARTRWQKRAAKADSGALDWDTALE